MHLFQFRLAVPATLFLAAAAAAHAADRYVSLTGGHVPPFTSWADAATNIQAAVDAAAAGETVWVTNGVYATGWSRMRVMKNRVTLRRALTLRSLNGAAVTVIDGGSVTNSDEAVRCVYMTDGAVLDGFTLYHGATRFRPEAGFWEDGNGGAVLGMSTNALVRNCILATNLAYRLGGGARSVTLSNCTLAGNRVLGEGSAGGGLNGSGTGGGGASGCVLINCRLDGNATKWGSGGGTRDCVLRNSFLTRNSSWLFGGAAYGGTLVNSTASGNVSGLYGSSQGGAVAFATLTNCIVAGNSSGGPTVPINYVGATFAYCNSSPLPSGPGNLNLDPLFLADGMHLAADSPCRGAGTSSVITGFDLDGQPWADPPPMGCDEWLPEAVMAQQPTFAAGPSRRELVVNAQAAGQEPFAYFWFKDGSPITSGPHYPTVTSNLLISGFGPADGGSYWVLASNHLGVATSRVAQLNIHCVDAGGTTPTSPFLTWATAATNIQDAIDAASPGAFILVTNGLYATGGKAMDGDLTNRVAVDKPLALVSVNGPAVTTIKGAWDPISTNGPGAVRGVWLADGATLAGFTVRNGATRTSGSMDQTAGGVAGSRAALISECVIRGNVANTVGGGIGPRLGSELTDL
jgi:hypothetical protein